MQKIDDINKLNLYIQKYSIQSLFSAVPFNKMELHYYEQGEHMFKTGEPAQYLYFLVEGKLKVYTLLENGKSLLLRFYSPMEIIGDAEFSYSNSAISNVKTLQPSYCIGIPMSVLRKNAQNDHIFLMHICKSLSEKLSTASVSSSINMLYPLENRLASYLLAITPGDKTLTPEGILADSYTEIAELLGTSYRHLNRILSKFCSQQYIKKENNLISILNRDKLEALAGDLYK